MGVGQKDARGDLGDVVVLALALLLLQLEGDTADGALLDTLHQVGGEAGDLVAKTPGGSVGLSRSEQALGSGGDAQNFNGALLGADQCDLIEDLFVGVAVGATLSVAC